MKYKALLIALIWIVTFGLILYWYDWKLLVILFLFGWAMNGDNSLKQK